MTGSTLVTSHFLQIFKKTIWNQVLQLHQNNVNLFFDNHLNFMNVPINSHAQLKKLNKKKKKFHQKPWITRVPQISIHKKNRLFKKCSKCNNQVNKNPLHNEYKVYRNELSILMKQSKKRFYANYFKNNMKDMKKHGKESNQ